MNIVILLGKKWLLYFKISKDVNFTSCVKCDVIFVYWVYHVEGYRKI